MRHLQGNLTNDCVYLEGGGPEGLGTLRQLVLYHSADGKGNGLWALHLPMESRYTKLLGTWLKL